MFCGGGSNPDGASCVEATGRAACRAHKPRTTKVRGNSKKTHRHERKRIVTAINAGQTRSTRSISRVVGSGNGLDAPTARTNAFPPAPSSPPFWTADGHADGSRFASVRRDDRTQRNGSSMVVDIGPGDVSCTADRHANDSTDSPSRMVLLKPVPAPACGPLAPN